MGRARNPVEKFLELELKADAESARQPVGMIANMLSDYNVRESARLLGFLLDLGYEEMQIVTCDSWKRKCGGLPKNSFIIVKINEDAAGLPHGSGRRYLILGRVRETSTTPVAGDIQSTIFQIHKVQAQIDPLTNAELQWGALKADILGTYYDKTEQEEGPRIAFGNDVDSFLSPHFYEVYVPSDHHLEILINSFVDSTDPIRIGRLRYTETETINRDHAVEVRISPQDFISNRTALFGKTRMGKSNTIKVILDTMLSKVENLGQVVFDLSGEYTYPDPQTAASIYIRFSNKCSRYSLKPRYPDSERRANVPPPAMLRTNFYRQIEMGHAIIRSLFNVFHPGKPPDYIAPFLGWEPVDEADLSNRFPNFDEQTRYKRALSMYRALLHEAGFSGGDTLIVPLCMHKPIKQRLAREPEVSQFARMTRNNVQEVDENQTVSVAARLYAILWSIHDNNPADASLFPTGGTGKPYFESIHLCLLRMMGDRTISGPKKFTKFKDYHDPQGSDIVAAIVSDIEKGKTVLIDLANADQVVAEFYSKLIAESVLGRQMEKFSTQEAENFNKHSVLFYFEEAHNLFRADDKNLTSIYNKLAKEGAKFRIGMVYATQSMTTLSPDLLKNTENFFIAHLNDDREIHELERRYEFNGMGIDVQRAKSKGYVRMITLSHRYALPVQIKLFEPRGSGKVG